MKQILIAGAGHGGLVAAVHLANAGHRVRVVEKGKRADLGHDWHDWLEYAAFDGAGIPRPDDSICLKGVAQGFRNPKATVMLRHSFNQKAVIMDRKELIAYLLKLAEEAGVVLDFETEAVAPLLCGSAVEGLIVRQNGALLELHSDLLIDSAGLYSPVRTKLPASFGIPNTINPRSVFHVWRAYYENTTGERRDPPYIIDFFHNNRPGIDWSITEPDYVDILVGKFSQAGELTEDEVDAAVAAYRAECPYIGSEIVRGGSFEDIPISRMLPMIVADGYAAVGDSAGMTVPLNGSGIILSMNAGKILADTVNAIDGACTKKALWPYEYEYFMRHGKDLVMIDIIKTLFTYVKGADIDYLMEKKILTNELLHVGSGPLNLTAEYFLNLLTTGLPLLKLVPAAAKCFKTLPFISLVCNAIPKDYDEESVKKWVKRYQAL